MHNIPKIHNNTVMLCIHKISAVNVMLIRSLISSVRQGLWLHADVLPIKYMFIFNTISVKTWYYNDQDIAIEILLVIILWE